MKRSELKVGETYAVKVSGRVVAAVVIDLATPLYAYPNDWARGSRITPELGDSPVFIPYVATEKQFKNSVATMVAMKFVNGGDIDAVATRSILGPWSDHERFEAEVQADANKRLDDRRRAHQLRARLRSEMKAR